jgi:hypothetical protein
MDNFTNATTLHLFFAPIMKILLQLSFEELFMSDNYIRRITLLYNFATMYTGTPSQGSTMFHNLNSVTLCLPRVHCGNSMMVSLFQKLFSSMKKNIIEERQNFSSTISLH